MPPSSPLQPGSPANMTFLSLFSGIGMIDYGVERAGFRCVGQVEISPFRRHQLARHWPHVRRINDVHSVHSDSFEAPTLIVGGFPCQPVSQCGQRRGQTDPRWLWPQFARVIDEYRPDWIIAENVPGLRTQGADDVLQDLEVRGYAAWPLVVAAQHVGSPQRRFRVWIVGHVVHSTSQRCSRAPRQTTAQVPESALRSAFLPDRSMLCPWPPRPSGVDSIPLMADGFTGGLDRSKRLEAIRAVGDGAVWVIPFLIATWIRSQPRTLNPEPRPLRCPS
jgi:DNA (cytosine-5)-methyltransferase 1